MPNRIVRGYVCDSVRRRTWSMPCAICARADDIECDHIIALADGGDNSPSNIQPLCRVCNILKRQLTTNAAVAQWIAAHREAFARKQDARTQRTKALLSGEYF